MNAKEIYSKLEQETNPLLIGLIEELALIYHVRMTSYPTDTDVYEELEEILSNLTEHLKEHYLGIDPTPEEDNSFFEAMTDKTWLYNWVHRRNQSYRDQYNRDESWISELKHSELEQLSPNYLKR